MLEFKGGRLPNDPSKPRLKFKALLDGAIPSYPENRDWLSQVPNFPMYANDRIGDCVFAAAGHMIQVYTTYGQHSIVTLPENDIVGSYSAVTGYDPTTGANDNGTVMQSALDYWRKTGIGGHKILAFAEVDVHNKDELRTALDLFGVVYIGINFPNTAMQQFHNNQPWDVVQNATIEGGHAINAGYYDVSDNMWKVVTWGKVQPMTQNFWDHYVEEAWVVISSEWLDAQGSNPAGIDVNALNKAFSDITGEPAPIPVPAPQPTPAPVPEPTPAPVDPDSEFIEEARNWLARGPFFYRKFQKELEKWLATKE